MKFKIHVYFTEVKNRCRNIQLEIKVIRKNNCEIYERKVSINLIEKVILLIRTPFVHLEARKSSRA